jgi:CPA1 family monovalent cation:H+ antiporter
MELFEWTLAILLGSVVIAGLARRIAVPYPSLLALAGAGLAFLPFAPEIEIDPELALVLFVAPVLVDAAFDASPRDLKRYARPLASLVLIAVGLTTACVAFVGWAIAGLPVAAAVALGAIVAPPDAVAASAVLNQMRPPRRITAILQGESLLNDATALLIYRLAVGAAAGSLVLSTAAPLFALSALLSVVVGYVLARVLVFLTMRVKDAASATILQFVSTFGVWMIAEATGLSPIVTIVAYAMTAARIAPRRMGARNRVSSYSVWETAVFVLNVVAFVLMGLQARPILERLSGSELQEALVLSGAVLATVILVRLVWVVAAGSLNRLQRAAFGSVVDKQEGFRSDFLIGWCGMRGLVTLATAFALPHDFPGRDPIVLAAFCVVLGTLVLQGLTLKPILERLKFDEDTSVEIEVSRARVAIMQIAIESLDGEATNAAAIVRKQYEAARMVAADPETPQAATDYDELRLRAIKRQREKLDKLRDEGTIGDEAYHRIEEEIDWAELDASPAGRFQPLTT